MSQSYKGEFTVFLCLHEDTEVHNGKGITPRTQRKLGFEPSSAQLKQPGDMDGKRAQTQSSPLVDWGYSRTWKAVRLGAGDRALRAHDVHALSGGWSTDSKVGGCQSRAVLACAPPPGGDKHLPSLVSRSSGPGGTPSSAPRTGTHFPFHSIQPSHVLLNPEQTPKDATCFS